MEYVRDFDKIEKRLHLLLQNELMDRCCVAVTAPKDPLHPYHSQNVGDETWYMDAEWIVKRNVERLEKTYFAGDALPHIFPYFGTGGHAKYFNDDISLKYTPETIWIDPYLESCADLKPADLSSSRHFKREVDILKYLCAESNGRYYVAMPDNCGSYDALAQLRGNEDLLMDFFDDPEAVEYAAGLVVDCLRDSCRQIFDVVRENNHGGSTHSWMNLHSTGGVMQLQCDMSVMLSKDIFDRFIMKELQSSLDFLTNAAYHVDGQEQIRHLDSLLSLEKLNMLQWTQVASQPPVTDFIPQLKKIQAAGKGLVLVITPEQIKPLLENISSRGVMLVVNGAKNPEEADDIVAMVNKLTRE